MPEAVQKARTKNGYKSRGVGLDTSGDAQDSTEGKEGKVAITAYNADQTRRGDARDNAKDESRGEVRGEQCR